MSTPEPPSLDSTTEDDDRLWQTRLPELLLAAAVVVLGLIVIWETRDIRIPRNAANIGPRTIPYLIGSGLVLVGLWLALEVVTGRVAGGGEAGEDVDTSLRADWPCLAIVAASFVLYILLIERAGFVIASTLLFAGSAFGMGKRRIHWNLAMGLALSVAVYLMFTRGLDLRLPAGWLGDLF